MNYTKSMLQMIDMEIKFKVKIDKITDKKVIQEMYDQALAELALFLLTPDEED